MANGPMRLSPFFGNQQAPFPPQAAQQGGGGFRIPNNILGLPGLDDPRSAGALQGFSQGFLRGDQSLADALTRGIAGGFGGFAAGEQFRQQQAQQQAEAEAQAQQQQIENQRAAAEAQRKAAADAVAIEQFNRQQGVREATETRLGRTEQRQAGESAEDLAIRQQQLAINRQNLASPVIKTLIGAGIDPQSPQGQALVRETLTKPLVQQGAKPPTGFRFADPNDPLSSLETIPGGPADRMTPEQAAKFQLSAQGATDVQSARQLIFNKDGTINRKILTQANAPFGAIPGTDGVLLKSLMRTAIEAQLRSESGAAVPESEIERGMERFMPSVFDNPKTVKSKIDRLEGLLSGALEASGREAAPTTEATLQGQPAGGGVIPQAQAGAPAQPTTQADFDALPSGATFINPADGRTMVKN